MATLNLIREIRELKNQLAYSKNLGFFFGAGTSCSLGVPNIATLTTQVENNLDPSLKTPFSKVKDDLVSAAGAKPVTIEDILNQLRQIRSITSERGDKKYLDVSGKTAKKLDDKICKEIYALISASEKSADLSATKKFFSWLNLQNRDYSKELFTSNYDLIFEKSLEQIGIPYFDGFVGSYEPFFWQEIIDKFVSKSDLTQSWLRLWKVHGSLNWFWKTDPSGSNSIIRTGKVTDISTVGEELVIYPSREKYDSSKKQPFVSYFDRLKNYLTNGELLFLVSGYSFADEHINEVVFNALRQNNRLYSVVFFFNDSEVEEFYKLSSSYLNIAAMGPSKAIVNGTLGDWGFDSSELSSGESPDSYWDTSSNKFKLGDFKELVEFLITISGKRESIEASAIGK